MMNCAVEFCTFYDIPDMILNINGHQQWNTCCSTCLCSSVLAEPCDLVPLIRIALISEEDGMSSYSNVICPGDLPLLVLGCLFFHCILEKLFYCSKKGSVVSILEVNPAHFMIPAVEIK